MPRVRFNVVVPVGPNDRRWVSVLAEGPDDWTIQDFIDEAERLGDAVEHDVRYDRNAVSEEFKYTGPIQIGGIEPD